MGLLERIIQRKYQVCLIDPEGDYENLEGVEPSAILSDLLRWSMSFKF